MEEPYNAKVKRRRLSRKSIEKALTITSTLIYFRAAASAIGSRLMISHIIS